MIRIDLDIKMPDSCDDCPLQDEEFYYCHGRLCSAAWECSDYRNTRPEWCPLLEVRKSCTECMLGAPYEICWKTQCINYSFKKKKEEERKNHIKECLKNLEKRYEA